MEILFLSHCSLVFQHTFSKYKDICVHGLLFVLTVSQYVAQVSIELLGSGNTLPQPCEYQGLQAQATKASFMLLNALLTALLKCFKSKDYDIAYTLKNTRNLMQ